MQITRGCLIAAVRIDVSEDVLRQFRADFLERIRDTSVRGVILDFSGVEVIDAVEFDGLRRTMDMAALMGVTPIVVGLRAGVVSSLMDLGADVAGVRAAFDLDQALDMLDEFELNSRTEAGTRVIVRKWL
jgi:rsbT antagonist protein RsbS